jgi:uncharacterized protein
VDIIVLVGVALALLIGLGGLITGKVPGLALIWGAILVWASIELSVTAWIVLAIASVLAIGNYVLQQVLAGREFSEILAPAGSLVTAAIAATIGFLLARTLGLLAGFAAGLYFAERRRLGKQRGALPRARDQQRTGRARLIELVAALLATGTWLVAVVGAA